MMMVVMFIPFGGFSETQKKEEQGTRSQPFAFIALGDLHFDRMAHHDVAYVEQKYGDDDVSQIKNYSRLTESVLPKTFAEVREVAGSYKPRVAFVAQLGDLVEGLCGTPQLARRQCEEAIAFVEQAHLGAPFLVTRGNHDGTGPGAPQAYSSVILPFLSKQAGQPLETASFAYEQGDALFAFFDAYDPRSLDWLEQTLATRRARHVFVLIHPPVVPIGARSLWPIYSRPNQRSQRERLLSLLGKHRAIVLCAHLHKYAALVRQTDQGRFFQLSLSTVISSGTRSPSLLSGMERYGPDLVALEPRFEPGTERQRRDVLKDEAPFIEHYEYADAPGYAVITVRESDVRVEAYLGLGRNLWRTLTIADGGVKKD